MEKGLKKSLRSNWSIKTEGSGYSYIEDPTIMDRKCLGCGKIKRLQEFHKKKKGTQGRSYRCKSCRCLTSKEHYWRNRDKILYRTRHTLLNVKGKKVKVKKRQRPNGCELCGKENYLLNYHHWNDDKLYLGMWVCTSCHVVIHGFESKITKKQYLDLKDKIEKSFVVLT